MSLNDWVHNGWLKPHRASRQEIADLLTIVNRDLQDARARSITADWRFGIAYNAALKLCTILLHAEGYRAVHESAHFRTLATLPLILGEARRDDADYLETCRRKRNLVEYDRAGGATDADAEELIQFASDFRVEVTSWLKTRHPELA